MLPLEQREAMRTPGRCLIAVAMDRPQAGNRGLMDRISPTGCRWNSDAVMDG
ncbi:MAG: hypothetical protein ACKO58_05920 [Cyanobium sp.]